MNNKLTYKIKEILTKDEYTDIIIKHKNEDKDVKISDAKTRFRYEPKLDKAYLSFGNENEYHSYIHQQMLLSLKIEVFPKVGVFLLFDYYFSYKVNLSIYK